MNIGKMVENKNTKISLLPGLTYDSALRVQGRESLGAELPHDFGSLNSLFMEPF